MSYSLCFRMSNPVNVLQLFWLQKRHYASQYRISKLLLPHLLRKKHGVGAWGMEDMRSKSLRLMTSNGVFEPCTGGLFTLLPLGLRSQQKLINLIDKHMSSVGGQKIEMPCLIPADLWKRTGRYETLGSELFTLLDRNDRELCLGPTHEEAVTSLITTLPIMHENNLPLILYQITKKFRDEPRYRFGLLRAREFLMKDMYSFDANETEAQKTYKLVTQEYENFFKELGVDFRTVEAHTGNIGGELSHEFHFIAPCGEDFLILCSQCDFGKNKELVSEISVCPKCGGQLYEKNSIEVGHTFFLGNKYSSAIKAKYLSNTSEPIPYEMGCYGLGVTRIMAASIEVLSALEQIRWPLLIAPFKICIIPPKHGSKEWDATSIANKLEIELRNQHILADEVIVDDRNKLTIGWRLKDIDRMGIPIIIIVGKMALESEPKIEIIVNGEHNIVSLSIAIEFVLSKLPTKC